MIEPIKLTDEDLVKIIVSEFPESYESYSYLIKLENAYRVLKIFKQSNTIENKIVKLNILSERLKHINNIPHPEFIVHNNGSIIGYIMTYISGTNAEMPDNRKYYYTVLNQIKDTLNELHKSNIICADLFKNILIKKDKAYIIDIDNFKVDDYKVDAENIFLRSYKNTNDFDYKFDNYLLNLLTISYIYDISPNLLKLWFRNNPSKFNIKNETVKNIIDDTINLKPGYNGKLILDEIDTPKQFKRIRFK